MTSYACVSNLTHFTCKKKNNEHEELTIKFTVMSRRPARMLQDNFTYAKTILEALIRVCNKEDREKSMKMAMKMLV